jgi:sulfur carrier protein
MQILVNGEPRSVAPELRLPSLIEQLRLGERRLAVELNGAIVPRSTWPQTALRDGDRVEIVHAIGGG